MRHSFYTLIIATTAVVAIASGAFAKGSDTVRETQMRLSSLGYYTGPSDGKMTGKTVNALIDFQARNGLKANGKITPETNAMLRQTSVATAGGYYYEAQPVIYNGRDGTTAYVYNNVQPAGVTAWTPQGQVFWSPNRTN